MKLTLNVTTTLLIVFSLILTSLVLAQNPPKAIQVKGKPAKSTTVKMVTTRAVRRSSSAALMSVGAAAPVLPSVPSPLLQSHEPQYVPNQVLVKLESREETRARLNLINLQAAKLRNEALRADIQENVEATNITLALTRSIENPREGDLLVVNLPADTSPDKAITELRSKPGIKSVQKNWIYTLQQNPVSNDGEYTNGALWGMFGDDLPVAIGPTPTTNSFGTQAEKAWFNGHVGSRAVCVGVIDGGIQVDHPDLDVNIWTNPGETGTDETGQDKSTNGRDDDGDGLKDDVHGWDFSHQDGSVFDGEAPDEHGTHVAGTIGAAGNNALGVAGVNWSITIITAKVFGATGATTDRIVEAISYFVRLKERGINVIAINNSWGGGPYDSSLFEAIKQAARSDILFIAAAGNYGKDNDADSFYPASYDTRTDTRSEGGTAGVNYDSVIAVAAIDRDGNLPGFSDFGKTSVDLGAPGDAIISTIPGNDYGFMSGTSMATPHVTGAVALYASTHSQTAEIIRAALLQAVIPTGSLQGKTVTGGRVNVGGF
jgi:subtilisin family serine protease